MRRERPIFSSSSTISTRLDAMVCNRQQQAKARAAQFSFHQYQVPARKQRAFARDGEAQAHALFLERYGGLKQRGARLLAQPRPGIMHFDRHAPVSGDSRAQDADRKSTR